MCNYFSCIVTPEKVFWSKLHTSHEEIIYEYKLDDTNLENRKIVRVEIKPEGNLPKSRDRKDWHFRIDESGSLPKWWSNQAEERAWAAWEESVKTQILIGNERVDEIKDALVWLYGNSQATLYGNSQATLKSSTAVYLQDEKLHVLKSAKIVREKESKD